MKVVAIIQARMGSSRLPGKVLELIEGRPLLWYVVHRTKLAKCLDQVVVATPFDELEDLAIHAACSEWGIPCIGAMAAEDVLGRYAAVAAVVEADIIVRITADCPFVDPRLIDAIVWRLYEHDVPYSSNVIGRAFPDGLDVEAFTRLALDVADAHAIDRREREHVTPYLQRCATESKVYCNLGHTPALGDLRWTVDTAEDLAFAREMFRRMAPRWDFAWTDLLLFPAAFRTNKEARAYPR